MSTVKENLGKFIIAVATKNEAVEAELFEKVLVEKTKKLFNINEAKAEECDTPEEHDESDDEKTNDKFLSNRDKAKAKPPVKKMKKED